MERTRPLVGILMGSTSDLPVLEEASKVLDDLGIPWEMHVCSAHRSPEKTAAYAVGAVDRGLEVIIAGAGWAAHLAGFVAALSPLPVIGVPIDSSSLQGLDALLATVQMPPGVPVATMAIGNGGARNAGLLAAQILSLKDPDLREKVIRYKKDLAAEVEQKDRELQAKLGVGKETKS
jgi:phosphoribosylaminoimidazole carboxylase PurE protein